MASHSAASGIDSRSGRPGGIRVGRSVPASALDAFARWRQTHRAGKGILVEGCPLGEMNDPVVRLVHRQSCNARDITGHARIGNAGLESLRTDRGCPAPSERGMIRKLDCAPGRIGFHHQVLQDECASKVAPSAQCTSCGRQAASPRARSRFLLSLLAQFPSKLIAVARVALGAVGRR